ncbi:MAG: hypothetical protein F6K11_08185 [Leptolyngbya sp. SIO3F4]|nr:hypothetical protein [Leptolyngbya sp. SIO3F4]
MTSTAYLLISHGSRDPRHQAAINRLAQLVRERLNPSLRGPWSGSQSFTHGFTTDQATGMEVVDRQNRNGLRNVPDVGTVSPVLMATAGSRAATVGRNPMRLSRDRFIVGTAVLDFGLLPLHEQICEFGRRLSSAGIDRLRLVPLFLLRGKHVIDDIPREVTLAREALNGLIELEVGGYIGGHPRMSDLILNRFLHSPQTGRLLIAHGSRRVKGNRSVDNMAKSLGTAVAYWTTESNIEDQTIHLMQQGCSTLTIFPYFLFAGGITDAVAHLTEELAERFPRTSFRLLPPLGATTDMANLVVESLGHRPESYGVSRAEAYAV